MLRTGAFIDVNVSTSAMLTTLMNAVGVPTEHVGDPSVSAGVVSEALT
jgi:hypothetical protein